MDKKHLPFPYEYQELDPQGKTELTKCMTSTNVDYVRVGPKGYVVGRGYGRDAENIYNMPLRRDDVFVMSYQRSGTTWTQELVWLLENKLDYAAAAATPLSHRYPFLEFFMFFNAKWRGEFEKSLEDKEYKDKCSEILEHLCNPVTDKLAAAPSPRFIKTHLPLSLLPPALLDTARVVYVARDPRDVAVSYYHQSRLFKVIYDITGDFKDYWNLFIKDLSEYFMFFTEDRHEYYVDVYNKPEMKDTLRKLVEIMAMPASGMLAAAPSPRFIKTHLPMSLLPPAILDTARVVYVARDPRDVAVSSYHQAKLFKLAELEGDFKDFWNIFVKNLFTLTPYFEHIKEAWEKRNHPNMLFLFYEDMLKDLQATVRRVSDFLGKELSEEELARLCEHLRFDNFKNNKSVNFEEMRDLGLMDENESFIRKGKAGGWREYFDEEMTQQAESWMADNLRDTDLRFPHLNNQ